MATIEINKDNYFSIVQGNTALASDLFWKSTHESLVEWGNTMGMEQAMQDDILREAITNHFAETELLLKKQERSAAQAPDNSKGKRASGTKTGKSTTKATSKPAKRSTGKNGSKKTSTTMQVLPGGHSDTRTKTERGKKPQDKSTVLALDTNANLVERVSEDVALIKEIVRWNGKEKTFSAIRKYLAKLHKAYLEQRVTSQSPYVDQVRIIERQLERLLGQMKPGQTAVIAFSESTANELVKVAGVERQFPTVGFLAKYINMQRGEITREAARNLYNTISKSMERGDFTESDPYFPRINTIMGALASFANDPSNEQALPLLEAELAGLSGIGCCASAQVGAANANPVALAQTEVRGGQLRQMTFKTFRLPGRLGDFLGELDRNMAAFALTGDSGAGKSYFSFMLAKAFLRGGLTLKYFSLEEGIGKVTQEKLDYFDIGDEIVLTGTGSLQDVEQAARHYDVVVVDSFNKLDARPQDFERLRKAYPSTIFLMIFQKTTAGTMRGGASILFDSTITMDVRIENEMRIAFVEKSRYGNIGQRFAIEDMA